MFLSLFSQSIPHCYKRSAEISKMFQESGRVFTANDLLIKALSIHFSKFLIDFPKNDLIYKNYISFNNIFIFQ